jgi:hypothetical protein
MRLLSKYLALRLVFDGYGPTRKAAPFALPFAATIWL